jgi:hypothetical protein
MSFGAPEFAPHLCNPWIQLSAPPPLLEPARGGALYSSALPRPDTWRHASFFLKICCRLSASRQKTTNSSWRATRSQCSRRYRSCTNSPNRRNRSSRKLHTAFDRKLFETCDLGRLSGPTRGPTAVPNGLANHQGRHGRKIKLASGLYAYSRTCCPLNVGCVHHEFQRCGG